ncbi:hypothetical protein GCM10027259_07600 [Micromonospora palomenae]
MSVMISPLRLPNYYRTDRQPLAQVWSDISRSIGALETVIESSALVVDTNVVVESRLEFEAGELTCRTAWDRDGPARRPVLPPGIRMRPLHTMLWAVGAAVVSAQPPQAKGSALTGPRCVHWTSALLYAVVAFVPVVRVGVITH